MTNISRRNFLKSLAAGTAAIAIPQSAFQNVQELGSPKINNEEIVHHSVGLVDSVGIQLIESNPYDFPFPETPLWEASLRSSRPLDGKYKLAKYVDFAHKDKNGVLYYGRGIVTSMGVDEDGTGVKFSTTVEGIGPLGIEAAKTKGESQHEEGNGRTVHRVVDAGAVRVLAEPKQLPIGINGGIS